MENCVFIDIFTTQNDLYGKNNCPIQFCCEFFTHDEIFNKDKFFKPERRKLFNIIPDEKIMMSGFVNSGFNTENTKTSDYNGYELTEGLKKIHDILSLVNNNKMYVIGYNHIAYDIDILNKNFKRVLNLDPVVFENDYVIDLMKLAERYISVDTIGNYSMDSVFTYLFNDVNKLSNIRMVKSTVTDIKLSKMIFLGLVKLMKTSSLKSMVDKMNEIINIEVINFGKYKGAKLSDIFEFDQQYLNWLRNNREIRKQNPALLESIENIFKGVA